MVLQAESLAGNSDWRKRLGNMNAPDCITSDAVLSSCLQTLCDGGRVSADAGLSLMRHDSLNAITSLASMIKRSRYGDHVFFNENLHVSPTNICVLACRFCAFR